jgi:hypothetical protein
MEEISFSSIALLSCGPWERFRRIDFPGSPELHPRTSERISRHSMNRSRTALPKCLKLPTALSKIRPLCISRWSAKSAPSISPQLLSQSQKSYHNTADVPGRHTADHLAPSCVTARPTPLAEGGLASLLMASRAVVLEQVGHSTPSISPSST